jgi:dTDP-4-dehydrorhamnose reductase
VSAGRLLVVGASGLLGGAVARLAGAGWEVHGTFHSSDPPAYGRAHRLDLRDRAAVTALVGELAPAAVVNTAYRYDDWRLTADGAAWVAAAAATAGARLVHLSTDAVHGGRPEPYGDDEPPSPVFPYGAAKAAAETAVRAVDPGAAVVRCSLIIGNAGSAQVRRCLDLIEGRSDGVLYADEVRCPVGVDDLATAVLELVDGDYAGLLNVTGPEAVTRVELGRLVARRYGLDPARVPVGSVADSGEVRPALITLDTARARGLLRTRLRPVSEVLAA